MNKEIEKTVAEYMELKKNLDLLKNDGGEEIVKKMTEIYHDREKRKREDEDNHQKWLVEREKEIAKMKVFRGTQLIKQVRTQPPVVSTPVTDGATKVAPKDEKESSSESKPNATSEETSTPTVLQNEKVSLTSPKCNAEVVEESATDNTDIVMVETVQIETKTNEGEKPTAETVSGDNEATTEESNSEANESVVEEKILEVKTEEQDSTIERVDNGPSIENDASMADSTMEFDSSIKEDQPMTEVVIDHDASNDSKSSIGATGDDASNDRASRRKKKRYQNVTPNIQTRSTRSQTQVKVETETKESPIKQENAKLAPSKKRSTSIEDSSALSLSEDSNGPKTPLPDNSQNEDPDDDWKETGREIIRKLLNHPHVSLISMVECKNNLMQQKVANAMYRDDDLNAIKNRIETGQLKSSEELKKEFMTIFLNANMLNSDKNMSDMLLNMEKYVLDLFDHPDRRTKKRDSKAPNVLEVSQLIMMIF